MQEFWTRNRLFTHLAFSSARCRAFYLNNAFDIGDDCLTRLEQDAEALTLALRKKGRRRTFADRPPDKIFGPIAPEAVEVGICPSYRLSVPPHVSRSRRNMRRLCDG